MATIPTIWILGAGFSIPLGAPGLLDLFRPQRADDLAHMFHPYGRLSECVFRVQQLYARGKSDGLWSDPEAYLELVDLAAEQVNPGLEERLARLLQELNATTLEGQLWPNVAELSTQVRRALAAECAYFLLGANTAAESWLPYRQWFSQLTPDYDTIITFNYDLVLETLGGREHDHQVVLPGEDAHPGKVQIFKLHGSIDWWIGAGGVIGVRNVGEALASDGDVVIGTPGPRKMLFAQARFRDLWDKGLERLRSAHRVVFWGYRFPPSDAASRQELLTAIRENANGRNLSIHVVLGPESNDTTRMRHLLEAIRPSAHTKVTIHPLWS